MLSGVTVFEALQKRKGDKRRRQRNNDAGDIEGYLGPWGKFVDEQTVMKPSEVNRLYAAIVTAPFQNGSFVRISINSKQISHEFTSCVLMPTAELVFGFYLTLT